VNEKNDYIYNRYDRFVHPSTAQLEAFKPFGMGATMCPGRSFAKNQVRTRIYICIYIYSRTGENVDCSTDAACKID
jgi:hypothetical protein